jgi:hypothetical protein
VTAAPDDFAPPGALGRECRDLRLWLDRREAEREVVDRGPSPTDEVLDVLARVARVPWPLLIAAPAPSDRCLPPGALNDPFGWCDGSCEREVGA